MALITQLKTSTCTSKISYFQIAGEVMVILQAQMPPNITRWSNPWSPSNSQRISKGLPVKYSADPWKEASKGPCVKHCVSSIKGRMNTESQRPPVLMNCQPLSWETVWDGPLVISLGPLLPLFWQVCFQAPVLRPSLELCRFKCLASVCKQGQFDFPFS